MALNNCRKVYHFSEESARIHADALQEDANVRPNIYLCDHCGFWHVGYTPRLREKIKGPAKGKYRARRELKQKKSSLGL